MEKRQIRPSQTPVSRSSGEYPRPNRSAWIATPMAWILRYGAAVLAVAAGLGLRLALTAWIGPGLPTYITFYPAVMIAALLAGFGPGFVATALAGMVAVLWVVRPIGHFAGASPAERMGVVLFLGLGTFMSMLAALYRRNREKAAAYDREEALRETREALRQQAELIDPVRADVIAREMLRVVRERGSGAEATEQQGEALRRVPSSAGIMVAVVGLLVLVGWLFGLDPLKSVVPGLANMKANTALCFLFAGAALALREHRAVRLTCAGLVCAVAGLTMAEYLSGRSLGLDQLLFRDVVDANTIHPGRMVEATALGFLLSGASLWLLRARGRAALWTQQTLAAGAALIATVALLGYAYDVQSFFRFTGYSSMALHTAASLMILATGLIFVRREGLSAVLVAPGPGARLARRLVAAALLVPAVLGWLCIQGLRGGLFGKGMEIASLALAMILSLLALVFWAAYALRRVDAARREVEAQLSNQAELMDHAHEPLIVLESADVIRSWNRGAEALYGWSATEALGRHANAFLRTEGVDVAEMEAQLERAGRWEGELVHTTRGGRRVNVETRMTANRFKDGRMFILASNRDITEHKQAEAALRESEERFRSTMDNMLEGCQIIGRDWRYIYINDAAERHNRRPKGELIGKRYMDMWPGIESTNVFAVIRRCLEERTATTLENEFTFPDGRIGWFDLTVQPVPEGVFILSMDTTDRKRAEETIRQSEERFRILAENTPVHIMVARIPDGKILYANPGIEKLYGYAPGELLGKTMLDLYADPTERVVVLDELRRHGSLHDREVRSKRKDGSEVWISISVSRTIFEGSEAYIISSLDLSERKNAEENLQRALERLALAQRSAGAGVWDWDMTTDELEWSPELFHLFGLDPAHDRASFEKWRHIMHVDDRDAADERVRKAVENHIRLENEYRISLPSGEVRWISASGDTIYGAGDRPLRMSGICLDITARKVAEEAMRQTGEFLENLFNYANAPIICWDSKFRITRFNPAFERLTNLRREEVLGKDLSMLFPGDTREESLEKIKRTLSGEHWEVVEIPILRKNGETRIALWNSANVYAQDGTTIITTIAQGQDITERKEAEERLRRSNENLEQFAYVASHDLQEPLRVITSYSQLLEKRYKDKLDRDADDFIEFIVDATGRMQKLITDLLAYSRVGSKDLAPEMLDGNEVIRRVMGALSATMEASKAKVTYDRLPLLKAPEVSFTQLLQNLIANALKFRGPEPPEVHVAARQDRNEWVFSVRDNGIGIEPQYQEKIFQIFQRLHSKNEYPGTGIGLSICKKIVQNWGGRIWVESELGKGSTFYFTIPKERE